LVPLLLAAGLAQFARHLAQVRGAGILGVVDSVSEAGDFLLLGQKIPYVLNRICAGAINLLKHAEYSFVGATVQGSLQRADAGSDSRVHVVKRGGSHSCRKG